MLVAFHKPWGVASRFTPGEDGHPTLAGFGLPPRIYPIGRLDVDSEGLLLLTDERALVARLLSPSRAHPRAYAVQVEGVPSDAALARLEGGVLVQGRKTRPCRARRFEAPPDLPPREPPIRFRKTVPDTWIELVLTEGRNRQVRRMTAAVGHPTLRLVRVGIGAFELGDLPRGGFRQLGPEDRKAVLSVGRL